MAPSRARSRTGSRSAQQKSVQHFFRLNAEATGRVVASVVRREGTGTLWERESLWLPPLGGRSSQLSVSHHLVPRTLRREMTAKQRDARDETARIRSAQSSDHRARSSGPGMPHIFYARDRQMRAERPSLGLEPERLQPAHDFLLQMPERLGSIGQTNPDHARWARRGK